MDDQEEQPVSFQELKKRWAQQESTSQQTPPAPPARLPQQQERANNTFTLSSNSEPTNSVSPVMSPAPLVRSTVSSKAASALPAKPIAAAPSKAEPSPSLPPFPVLSSPPSLPLDQPATDHNDSRLVTAAVAAAPASGSISASTSTSTSTSTGAVKAPSIPPKPASVTLQPASFIEDTTTPSAKRVSLLAQQFDNKAVSVPRQVPKLSGHDTISSGSSPPTTSLPCSPPTSQQQLHAADDPFLDDEISDLSSGDSDDDFDEEDDIQVSSSNEDDHRHHYMRTTFSPPALNIGKTEKPKHRPPPPPPSKKYHSIARQEQMERTSTTVGMPIPSSTRPSISATPSTASSPGTISSAPPPVLPPRPSMVNMNSFDQLPQLPPRPSTSTLARSHTINHSALGTRDFGHLSPQPPSSSSSTAATSAASTVPAITKSVISTAAPIPTAAMASTSVISNLKRSQTMGPVKRDGSATPANLLTKSVYPDFSKATRNPPTIDDHERHLVGIQQRGPNQPMAASGSNLATGTQQVKVWNTPTCKTMFSVDLAGPEDNERVRSYVFTPSIRATEEGRYLWAGMQDGCLVAIDTTTNGIHGKTTNCHKHAVTFMLRRRNVEIWTLDESGLLAIWPVLRNMQQQQQQQQQQESYHPFEIQPIKHLVTPKAVTALIVGMDLWISSGRTIHVYRGLGNNKTNVSDDKQVRIPNDLGNITQLVTIPYYPGQVFASHDDGKVSAWDGKTLEKIQVNAVSLYGICAMATVGNFHLWTGYNTGMIYVYDTRPEKWLVVKTWRAHQGAIVSLLIDDSSFIRNEKSLQVISGDSHGNVAIWDGLMVENWQDQQLQKQALNYCSYKPARVMICSWNIDANKPEKLVGQDNELVHEWLGETQDPDIIVVGIQEIVDLESKKQTAKSLFASRKKTESLQEAEEMLTHRYRLWHDHLVRVIGDNYGHDTYTVIKTDQLVGLFSCVFVKNSEAHRIWNCDSTVVKTGLKVMNKSIHGNKGGIAIRFLFDHSSLCFVNCHLAAGQSHTQDRNANAESILQSANFPEYGKYVDVFANGGDGSLILDHEHCFLSGDLNYRIAMERKEVLELLKRKDKLAAWEALQIHDQLKRQNIINPLFKLLWFQEPPLLFDPTYKYDRGTDNYDSSEKKRVPAWCDRILCRSNMAQNIYYRRHEVKASDHRPISAAYEIQVKEIDGQKRDRLLEKIEKDWYHTVEKLIVDRKVEYVADFERCTQDQASQLLQQAHYDVDKVVSQLFYN